MRDVRELVRNFVVDNFVLDTDDESFTDDTDLKEAGFLDSLAVLKLITFLEEQFAVELRPEDIESNGLFSVTNIESLVRSRAS